VIEPGLFVGTLRHRRMAPIAHAFSYPVFMVLLDVDRLHALMGVSRLTVHDERFFLRALVGGDIGLGESFMDGEWSTPDLVPLARLMVRNLAVLAKIGRVAGAAHRIAGAVARGLRDNSRAGSRRHIHRHYDLGNDFFRLFLDEDHLMYSCGYFESADDSLEAAQARKIDRICERLDLQPSDRVLEIGSGWGGFAVRAAARFGCRVTTTTISDEQYRHAREWRARAGQPGSRIEVIRADYRELTGHFDKIVSIEMFEAVGLNHYDEYFAAVDRLLEPHGAMLLQTITVNDQWFPRYHGSPDWIERYIFPGGELASVGEIVKSLARATSMARYHAENFGSHYARTLQAWRARFHANRDRVRALGFDERFVRMWDLYLGYCEASFLERHAGLFQLMLVKNGTAAALFNEPWAAAGAMNRPLDEADESAA
jgi:cyclopropane-fatty-acyl-phospholipid synthase